MASVLGPSEKSTEVPNENGQFSDSNDSQLEANNPSTEVKNDHGSEKSPRNVHGIKVIHLLFRVYNFIAD